MLNILKKNVRLLQATASIVAIITALYSLFIRDRIYSIKAAEACAVKVVDKLEVDK